MGRGYLPLHLVILAPICSLMPQLPWSMARVTPLMAHCQNQHICRSKGLRGSPDFALIDGLIDLGTTFFCSMKGKMNQKLRTNQTTLLIKLNEEWHEDSPASFTNAIMSAMTAKCVRPIGVNVTIKQRGAGDTNLNHSTFPSTFPPILSEIKQSFYSFYHFFLHLFILYTELHYELQFRCFRDVCLHLIMHHGGFRVESF